VLFLLVGAGLHLVLLAHGVLEKDGFRKKDWLFAYIVTALAKDNFYYYH